MDDFLNDLIDSSKKKNKKSTPKIEKNKGNRRPPSSNHNILQFLDDLSIDDDINETDKKDNNNDIFKMDSVFNDSDTSDGNKTEVKFKNDIFNNFSYTKKVTEIDAFESNIISYLDFELRDLSSNFLSIIMDLSKETFDDIITEKVTSFLNDINKKISYIFQSSEYKKYEAPLFQTDEIINNFISVFSDLNQIISFQNEQILDEQFDASVNASDVSDILNEIETKRYEMIKFSDEFVGNLKIERNQLLTSENSIQPIILNSNLNINSINKSNEAGKEYIKNLFHEMEMTEMINEIEINFLDEKLKKIQQKKSIIEENKINQMKEQENQEQLIQDIIESKRLLFADIKNYLILKSENENEQNNLKFNDLLNKVSDFSQQTFVEITQCRMMTNQIFQQIENWNQIVQSLSNQQRMQFKMNLDDDEKINAQNAFSLSAKAKPDFIQQTRERLKELKEKRNEAKKLIE